MEKSIIVFQVVCLVSLLKMLFPLLLFMVSAKSPLRAPWLLISIKLEIWEAYWECPIDEDNTTRDHTIYLGSPLSSSIFLPRTSFFG